MKVKHTPAPWKTGEASWNEDGEVRYTLHGNKSANAADCALIEAAPDMLEALENLWKFCILEDQTAVGRIHLLEAERIIAKAKGK